MLPLIAPPETVSTSACDESFIEPVTVPPFWSIATAVAAPETSIATLPLITPVLAIALAAAKLTPPKNMAV